MFGTNTIWCSGQKSRRLKHQRSALPGHGLMHGGEKGLVIKRFIEIGGGPGPYRRLSHQVVVVPRHDDDARLGRNGLEFLLDFEAAHNLHPDINDRESHRIADNVREKTERLTKQLRLQANSLNGAESVRRARAIEAMAKAFPGSNRDPFGVKRLERSQAKTPAGYQRLFNKVARGWGLGPPTRAEQRALRAEAKDQQLKPAH